MGSAPITNPLDALPPAFQPSTIIDPWFGRGPLQDITSIGPDLGLGISINVPGPDLRRDIETIPILDPWFGLGSLKDITAIGTDYGQGTSINVPGLDLGRTINAAEGGASALPESSLPTRPRRSSLFKMPSRWGRH
jgi:hypothetical protein